MKTYQELIGDARAGKRGAFDELAARFRPLALAVAARHLKDASLREDAVQEAFLAVFLKLDQLRNPMAFPSWLKAIVYSACRSMRKGNVVEVPLEEGSLPAGRESGIEGPEELCVRWQTREMVARTLDALPGVAREVCLMRYVMGMSYKYISDALGIPEGTVKRRLHKAREQLARQLASDEGTVLRVGYMPITDHLLAMVSHHRHGGGGFSVHLRKFLSWDSLSRALVQGHLDAAFVMAPLAMHLRLRGVPLVYVLDAHRGGSSITVRDVASPCALRAEGMRVGLPCSVSTHELLLLKLLKEGRLDDCARWERFMARYVSPSQLDRLCRKEELDAFFCSEPWGSKAVAEGWGRRLGRSSDYYPGHVCCGLAVREGFALRHAGVLERYVRLLLESGRYVQRDPGAGARLQARYTGIGVGLAERVLVEDGIRFDDLHPDREALHAVVGPGLEAAGRAVPRDLDGFLFPVTC